MLKPLDPAAPRGVRALVVGPEHARAILDGRKAWELRTRKTAIRGRVGIIAKGTGFVVGTVDVVDCIGPLTDTDLLCHIACHRVTAERILAGDVVRYAYAWVLARPHRFHAPAAYVHPRGAVVWVQLR